MNKTYNITPKDTVDFTGGDTFIFADGVYQPFCLHAESAGKLGSPTILRAAHKWQAVVDGTGLTGVHGITSDSDIDYITLDGFQIRNVPLTGAKLYGKYCTYKNLWIHDCLGNGIEHHGSWQDKHWDFATIQDNLIERCGTNSLGDHGIYADGDQLTICRNVVRNNAAFGIHLYPLLTNSLIVGNFTYGHGIHRNDTSGYIVVGKGNRLIRNISHDVGIYGGFRYLGENPYIEERSNLWLPRWNTAATDSIVSSNPADFVQEHE
jgi:hypothetical protein